MSSTTVPARPPKGILDAADVQRTVVTQSGPMFEDEQAACIASALDTSLDAELLGLLAAGRITPDDSTPPDVDDVDDISAAAAGCVSDDALRAAMVAAWMSGTGSTNRAKVECYMDSYFSPAVGKVFAWTLKRPTTIEIKEADVHTDC